MSEKKQVIVELEVDMDVRTTEERVIDIIATQMGVDPGEISGDAHLNDLKIDSLDLVHLILAFEHEFDVVIPEEEDTGIETVADAVTLIKKLHKKQQGNNSTDSSQDQQIV
ncbi:MAG: acyl carrier protein [Candidatus Paceibacterota bacterium]